MKRLIFSSLLVLAITACESVPDYHPKAARLMAGFVVNDAPDSIRVSHILQITNTSQGASSYQWYWGDGNRCTDETPFIFYSDTGTYTIVLIASNGTETARDSATVQVLP